MIPPLELSYFSMTNRVSQVHVLPYHRRLVKALWGDGPHSLHLCGNVQRHLLTLIRELNVKTFDTGFPINFSTLRNEVGDDVTIYGGVRISTLLNGTPEDVRKEAHDILTSGIMRGGKFIMKEANNLPPCVPIENISAMYNAVREYGSY
ncbi:MAG: uroporphyrinogen decarboxylase family protein [Armatimonadota bacterium]